MVNVPEDVPVVIVTLEGTVAEPLDEERLTLTPPGSARPFKVRVPIALVPPTTEVGEIVNPTRLAGVMVSVPCWVLLPRVPVTVAVWVAGTPLVVTVKLADV